MLYDPFTGKLIKNVWHEADWQRWRPSLTLQQYGAIEEEIHRRLDSQQYFNTSWEPGSEWQYPFDQIWAAMNGNEIKAALFWGLIVQAIIIDHPLDFGFKKNEQVDGDREPGTTYFRIESP